jgi:1-acyl-sn-glycerol-3-phosphate acyltransferase
MMKLFLNTLAPAYAGWLARRFLDGVYVRNGEAIRALTQDEPVILAANHVCWWDGQIMLLIHRYLGVDARFLINQSSIDEMSFLGVLGGIGIDRSSISSTLAGLERSAAWLDAPKHSLWIFPQGRYRPAHVRPLELERGVRLLARMSGATIVPVGLTYQFLDSHLPSVVVSFGEPVRGRERLVQRLEEAITVELDAADVWFDTPERSTLPAMVPSSVVPFEDRFGSRFYLFWARVFGWIRGLVGM